MAEFDQHGFITALEPNEVFVFGSNLQGHHAGGAARTAVDKFGAVWGKGVGMQGQCYAIPTMGGMQEIKQYVADFLEYAALRPDLMFHLTKIGTGIAGYAEEEIAGLFGKAPANVTRPQGW